MTSGGIATRAVTIRDANSQRAVWDRRFLDLAALIATWSKDASTRVGCVVVDGHRVVRATGYNGLPRGVSDDVSARMERPRSLPVPLQLVHAVDMNPGVPSGSGSAS